MGFFKNMANEFGTKTGKAIGNKLYGKHADDYRIGMGDRSSPQTNRMQIERECREEKEREEYQRKNELKESITTVSFDVSNSTDFIKQMFSIATRGETAINEGDKETYNVCVAKIKEGVSILSLHEPNSSYIKAFNNKIVDLETQYLTKKQKDTKNTIITISIFLGVMGILFLCMAIFGD